jgi:hypothetical protein
LTSAAVPSATMPSPIGDDPETRLRKELRELERQRRRREEHKAARRVDREKAIASERSKYGTGLAPRLEQFFSRILRLQQQREADDPDKVEQSGNKAGRESKSPDADDDAVDCGDSTIIGEQKSAIAAAGRQVEDVPRSKNMDGNNNRSSLGGDLANLLKT